MPALSFKGALCSGHGGFPPRPSIEGSPDFIVTGKQALRVGDAFAVHCDPNSCHDGHEATGSPSFFINGQAAARIGDAVDCGSTVAQGDSTFVVGN